MCAEWNKGAVTVTAEERSLLRGFSLFPAHLDILSPWCLKQTLVPFYYCVDVWCKLYSLVSTGSRKLRLNADSSCDRCHCVCSWLSLCCTVTVFDSLYVTSRTAACPKFSSLLHQGTQHHMDMGNNSCVSVMLECIIFGAFLIRA